MIRTSLASSLVAGSSAADETASWTDRKASRLAQRAASARKASKRRRLVDPATCDRDYSQAELEFMQAIQDYKARSGRMFPTWSEVLEVVEGLGYRKGDPNGLPGELEDETR